MKLTYNKDTKNKARNDGYMQELALTIEAYPKYTGYYNENCLDHYQYGNDPRPYALFTICVVYPVIFRVLNYFHVYISLLVLIIINY